MQHLTLNFNFTISNKYYEPSSAIFHLGLSLQEVLCSPLNHLLSRVAEFSAPSHAPIQVDLYVNGKMDSFCHIPRGGIQGPIPPLIILSSFALCTELEQFMHQGMLVVTPAVPDLSSLADDLATGAPSGSQFSVVDGKNRNGHNLSTWESQKTWTTLWVASIQINAPSIPGY